MGGKRRKETELRGEREGGRGWSIFRWRKGSVKEEEREEEIEGGKGRKRKRGGEGD